MSNQTENKICQNCKLEFIIEPEDFNFYEKIKVPPPTFCPECRLIRRMVSTNERILYKRKCDLTGKDIFSMYDKDTIFPVYDTEVWYSDAWDPYEYGMDFDENRPFLEQYKELQDRVPRMGLVKQGISVNSQYTHRVTDAKNCYMVFRSSYPEDSLYIYNGKKNVRNCCDSAWLYDCELCYESVNLENCYNVKFGQESKDCRDSAFIYGCKNCSNCIGCVNLINQEYCIFNKKYTKEEYFEKLKELKLNTYSGISEMEVNFENFRKSLPQRAMNSVKAEDVSGNWFSNCKNVKQSFDCTNMKDCKYIFMAFDAQDCMDYFEWGNKAELIYESENCGLSVSRLYFSAQCWMGASDLYYCNTCPGARNCFGCFGLKKGEYAILNKKYSKQEYEILKEKIIKQMKEMPYMDNGIEYKFGEHFPSSFSDFAYNETAAGDFFPLNKEQALAKGYGWKDKENKNYETTIKSTELPETISEVEDSIVNEVIECGEKDSLHSVGAFKVTANELSFYRRMDLPLPRVSFGVRHMKRLAKRPPLQTIKRTCDKCNLEVGTVYTTEYAPILYCDKCYQQEVY